LDAVTCIQADRKVPSHADLDAIWQEIDPNGIERSPEYPRYMSRHSIVPNGFGRFGTIE
jgi:hypothetical protein